MASEIFLDMKDYPGEAQAKGFENQIDILSFSLGASNMSSVATGAGSGVGKVDLSSLSLQKIVDKASPKLFLACCQGDHIDKAKLTVREAGGKTPVEYYVLELKEIFVDSISWGGASGGGKPSESVSLSVAEVKIIYHSQDEKGAKKDKVEAGYNVKTVQAS
ncbi:MAG: type VI secretion system tube protein Hcp [Bryobacterales bacterium]|jgi:type VI secretion system secreted protein Hcp